MTTESDTPSGESGDLTLDSAAEAFSRYLSPPQAEPEGDKVDTEIDPPKKKEPEAKAEPEKEPDPDGVEEGADAPITIEVDGKQVTLTKAEIAELHKSGLRQSDYTQKTMALAEQRKAADAETQKAQQERHTYATNLQKMAAQLEGAIEQQAKIDWEALARENPGEWVMQRNLYEQRQAALQNASRELNGIKEKNQAEEAEAMQSHLATQQEALLAKLPQWKDAAKAETERTALKEYLVKEGYSKEDVSRITDHKAVILGRKAMLYDQMVSKMDVASKKMQNVPTKVERPGVSTNGTPDGRSTASRQYAKNPSIENMAKLWSSIL
jgi:hypothetical protein